MMTVPVTCKPRWMAGSGGQKSVMLSREPYKRTVRDGCGREVGSGYLDENRRPVRSKRGYARITKVYNDQNQVAEESYFDEKGQPVRSIDGYAHVTRQFDRNRNVTSERYFDEHGEAVLVKGGYAGRDARYNSHNALVEEAF